jgi:hypothetical protein
VPTYDSEAKRVFAELDRLEEVNVFSSINGHRCESPPGINFQLDLSEHEQWTNALAREADVNPWRISTPGIT